MQNKKAAGKFILDIEINFSAGVVCAVSGLILTVKKLFAREKML